MANYPIQVFLKCTGALLLLTGVAKLHLVIVKFSLLRVTVDSISGLPLHVLLTGLGVFEAILGVWLSFTSGKRAYLQCVVLASFCATLLDYRVVGFLFDVATPCPCLGFLGNILPHGLDRVLPPVAALIMMLGALWYIRSQALLHGSGKAVPA